MNHEENPATMFAHTRELEDVFKERTRQLTKFGPQNRPPFEWFLILSEEVGEVAKECVEIQFDDAAHPHADPERYYKELTEVAAVALAAMQNFNQRRPQLAARSAGPTADKSALAAAMNARFNSSLTADDILGTMPNGLADGALDFQATLNGFTDWYGIKANTEGTLDPTTIEVYPF